MVLSMLVLILLLSRNLALLISRSLRNNQLEAKLLRPFGQ